MRSINRFSPRRAILGIGAATALVLLASAPGCVAVTNTTAVQCTSEAECIGLGPEFAGTTCDKETKTCKKAVESLGCTNNKQCIDEAAGAPAICRKSDKHCVRLTTPECPNVFTKQGNSELANDDVIVIGALTPALHTELGTVMERAVEMAHAEISNSFVKGLPQNATSSGSRPLAIVACREFGSGLEGLLRAAKHLSENVQVPLVIGPVDPANGGLVAAQAFLPNRVLDILPTAVISSLANLPSPIAPVPLIWRPNFDDRAMASVSAAFTVNQLEPMLLAQGIQPPYRIAVLSSGDLLAQGVQAQLLKSLKFNGTPGAPLTAAENQMAGSCAVPPPSSGPDTRSDAEKNRKCLELYNFGDINDTLGNPNPEGQIGSTLAELWNFQPNIIFHTYGPAGIPKAFFPVEGGFPGPRKPFHVGLSAVWNGFGPLFPFLDSSPQTFRNGRMFSVQNYTSRTAPPFPVDSPEVTAWVTRFEQKFPEFKTSVSPKSQNVWLLYDATYLAAYAIVALGDKPVTGENLAGTLSRFGTVDPNNVKGQPITTYYGPGGPNGPDIDKAYAELKAGRNIDLQGLFGTMDFDTSVAAPAYGLEITCPSLLPGGGTKGSGFHFKVDSQRAVVTTADGKMDSPATSPLVGCPPPPPPP